MNFFRPMRMLVGALLVAGAALAVALEPHTRMADVEPRVRLDALVPEKFGVWHVDRTLIPLAPDPELIASMRQVYDQTLQRTYVDDAGRHVMLSIAYSSIPSAIVDLHTPDLCYPAQGFRVERSYVDSVVTPFGRIPAKRLVTRKLNRNEPLTYWILTGNKVTLEKSDWRWTQLGFGLRGKIADGMLFRVSSIGSDPPREYAVQDEFINAMMSTLPGPARSRLSGDGVGQ